MRKTLSILLHTCFYSPILLRAQDKDMNITIQQAAEEYRFVKTNKANPVQVKETIETIYQCNDFRTQIPVVEFYNDQEEINGVDIGINGEKAKGVTPQFDYYSIDNIFYSDARVCYF